MEYKQLTGGLMASRAFSYLTQMFDHHSTCLCYLDNQLKGSSENINQLINLLSGIDGSQSMTVSAVWSHLWSKLCFAQSFQTVKLEFQQQTRFCSLLAAVQFKINQTKLQQLNKIKNNDVPAIPGRLELLMTIIQLQLNQSRAKQC